MTALSLQYQVTHYTNTETGYPSWSPDGTKIAYHAYLNGKFDIYIISSLGEGNPIRITSSNGWNRYPSWSHDGTKIAFVNGTNEPPWLIKVVSLATAQESILTSGYDPTWSPDDGYIVFAKGDVSETNLWKRELSTGIENQLTFTADIEQNPDWSNNGQTIIYNHNDVNPTIWTIPAVGGTPTQVPLDYGYGPKWSPDDTKIAVDAGNSMGGYSIYVFNMITHNLFQATPDNTYWCLEPDWAPDGSKIAYLNGADSNIWVVTYGTSVENTSLGNIRALYK
jgi:dipeptidyl aminopeptidase/acylaminoacyl peptidase